MRHGPGVRDSLAHGWTLCPFWFCKKKETQGVVVIFHRVMSGCPGAVWEEKVEVSRNVRNPDYVLELPRGGEMASKKWWGSK